MSEAVSKFISGLAVHFGEPKFDVSDLDKPAAHRDWLRAMVRNLGGFSDDTLKRTEELIVATRTYRTFPLISECKKAAIEADKQVKAEKPRLIGGHTVKAGSSVEEKERLALELILGPLGRRAAREGWVHSLFTFTRDHMRLPTDETCSGKCCRSISRSQIECCKAAAKGFDKAMDANRAAPAGSLQAALVPLGISMLQKRDALASHVETGVLP